MSDIKIYKFKKESSLPLNFFMNPVSAGFPSPAEDHLESSLDLNEHLIDHPSATFYVYAKGHSMEGSGICDGDIMVVDRSLEPQNGNIVIASISGDFTVKRLMIKNNKNYLVPSNKNYKLILITDDMDVHIWGVVIHSIHSFK